MGVPALILAALVAVQHRGAAGAAPAEGPARIAATAEDLDEVARAKDRAGRHAWAQAIYDDVLRSADRWTEHPTPLPRGPTGLYHDYFCPDHGVVLRHDASRPTEHRCPVDDKLWQGDKLDAYWVTATIRKALHAAVDCGLAWRWTGEEKYARSAAAVLREAAGHYRSRIAGARPPRWMAQTLDEAVCVLDAARVFRLISGSPALPPDDAAAVVEQYLVPTARFLASERRLIHNIHSWMNAAILAIGVAAGDASLVDLAIGGSASSRHGLRDQLREGVYPDGLWREGSIAYHFYTLSSLVEALIAARGLDIDLREETRIVKAMFVAPLALADSQGVIPPTNDGAPAALETHVRLYEIGAGLFPEEPSLRDFLVSAYRRTRKARTGWQTLVHGPEALPEPAPTLPESRAFPDSGLGVLRAQSPHGGGGETYALIDFGPHGGAHGHPDKLAVSIHGLGRVLAPDSGTSGYSLPLTDAWYRQTLSHNTIVVDRRSQRPAQGVLLSFRGDGPVRHLIASAGDAYPGIEWTRGVYLSTEGCIVIIDRLAAGGREGSGRSHRFDWVFHAFGELDVSEPVLEPLARRSAFGRRDGYKVPESLRRGDSSGSLVARWAIRHDTPTQPAGRRPETSGSLWLRWIADGETEVFAGEAPGNPPTFRLPFVVARQRGRSALFRAVLEPVPDGAAPRVRAVIPIDSGVRVVTTHGAHEVTLP